ncbi:MAG: hypothetical protein PVI31_11875 [Gemmatimonadota bacterium]
MCPGRLFGLRVLCAMAVTVAGTPVGVLAQDASGDAVPRVPASIDYVSVDGLYLDIGSDQGAVRGDTVAVYGSAADAAPMGRVVLVSVTRRRSVVQPVDELDAELGDVLFLPLTAPEAVAEASTATTGTTPTASTSSVRTPVRGTGPRVSGRLSLDLDARETHTSWGGDLFGDARRRFFTPTTRLSLTATELPGGLSFRTSLRAAYRYDDLTAGPPPMSVRAYEAAVTKEFDEVPVQVTVGRFGNRYEAYSAYWDGAMLRVGGRRGGMGVVAGFEPARYDEGFSTDLPKLSGFADLSLRGRSWRYDTDMSAHILLPSGGVDRGFLGWSQSVSVGRVSFNQRLRLDGGIDGTSLSLGQVRARVGLRLTPTLGLRATYGRSRTPFTAGDALFDPLVTVGPYREEATAGFDLRGTTAWLSAEAGRTRREGEPDAGLSVTGRTGVALGHTRLTLSAREWKRADQRSTSVAPGLSFQWMSMDWRTGYRYYRTDLAVQAITSQAVEVRLGFKLFREIRMTVRGEQQWGSSLSGSRIQIGLWRSF